MKHRISTLEDALLDAAVAKAEGKSNLDMVITEGHGDWERMYSPSDNWQDGGPIIEREQISLTAAEFRERIDSQWRAELLGALLGRAFGGRDHAAAIGRTPLIAAMRAYVASKYGDEIDL